MPGWQTSVLGSDIRLLKTHPAYNSAKKFGPAAAASGAEGMVLPFTPAVMTFKNVNYYADPPPVRLWHLQQHGFPESMNIPTMEA